MAVSNYRSNNMPTRVNREVANAWSKSSIIKGVRVVGNEQKEKQCQLVQDAAYNRISSVEWVRRVKVHSVIKKS